MKRFFVGLLIFILCLSATSFVFAAQPINLVVNGQAIQCDVPPQIVNGRTMVSISTAAQALGCQVSWDGATRTVNITSSGSGGSQAPPIQYYFPRAGQDPVQPLVNVINSANSTLDIAIYSLTEEDIVNAIAAAETRGVSVRILTDKSESKTASQSNALDSLKADGIPIKINSHSGLMHMKVTIADNSTVTTGSYNYSNEATYENDEVLVIIHSPSIAQVWDNEFQSMWTDNDNYEDYQ
ncbi:MAG: phospholipase D-like domain-containing protein [Thermacetogeniaceae bacterium]|jgi:phosphatidylserine/phosphatidylglycerophosphate/cardiolipin synthase-like enzyme